MQSYRKSLVGTVLAGLLLAPGLAMAEERYMHEHVIHALPHERFDVVHGGEHYYFSHGYWYHGHGPDFIAVAPPFGLRIGVLPWGYRTVVVGGLDLFCAERCLVPASRP